MTRDEIVRKSREAGGMFIVIPSVVKLDTELPLSAQMLYGIITWKCNSYAYTWATNRELGEALGVSAKRVSALLSQLEERGHVETEIEYKDGTREILRRYIYPVMKSARGILEDAPPPENEDTPPSEQAYPSPGAGIPPPENSEVICNKKRNKKDITPYSPPAGDGVSAEPKEGGPIEAQHSGFDGERRHSAANELSPQGKMRDAQLVPAKDKPLSKPRRSRQKKSVPTHAPERFEQFWQAYPGGGSRLKAVEEWDKLAASPELLTEMARALKRQKASRMWQEGVGIPHAFRWLRDQRWTDKLPETPAPRADSGGWAADPEEEQAT